MIAFVHSLITQQLEPPTSMECSQVQVPSQQPQKVESAHLLLQLQSPQPAVLLKKLLLDRSKVQTLHMLLQSYRELPGHCCRPPDLCKMGRLWG